MIHYHLLQLVAVVVVVAGATVVAAVARDVVVAEAVKVTRDVAMESKGSKELMGHHKSLEISLLTFVIIKAVMEDPMFKDFSREVIVEKDAAVAIVIVGDVITRVATAIGNAAIMATATEVTIIVAVAVAVMDAIAMATTAAEATTIIVMAVAVVDAIAITGVVVVVIMAA